MEESMSFEAVLFDFSDTLFWRNSAERLAVLLADAGTEVDAVALASVWVLSYEHGTEKPDPRMFELGCEGLGVSPSKTLMVGDSVEKDAGAARAGLTALTLPAHSGRGSRGLSGALKLVGGSRRGRVLRSPPGSWGLSRSGGDSAHKNDRWGDHFPGRGNLRLLGPVYRS
jgi:hypothetical protein